VDAPGAATYAYHSTAFPTVTATLVMIAFMEGYIESSP
jgi:hypothetical protein